MLGFIGIHLFDRCVTWVHLYTIFLLAMNIYYSFLRITPWNLFKVSFIDAGICYILCDVYGVPRRLHVASGWD